MGNITGKEVFDNFFYGESTQQAVEPSESDELNRDTRIARDANDKFAMTQGACEADFGVLEDFYEGTTARIGYPNPDFFNGMRAEHCIRPNHSSFFKTPNYDTVTCPKIEWHWANNPNAPDVPTMWESFPGETGDSVTEILCRISVNSRFSILPKFTGIVAQHLFKKCVGELHVNHVDRKAEIHLKLYCNCTLEEQNPTLRDVMRRALLAAFRDNPVLSSKAPEDPEKPELTITAIVEKAGSAQLEEFDRSHQQGSKMLTERSLEHVSFACFGRIIPPTRNEGVVEMIISVPSVLDTLVDDNALLSAFATAANLQHTEVKLVAVKRTKFIYAKDEGDGRICGRERPREPEGIDKFLGLRPAKEAQLVMEEVLALRLYTGPMYVLYNAKLRGFPTAIMRILEGNGYETTIFVLISGISKLSKITPIPKSRTLYKGLGGMLLSKNFWSAFQACLIYIQICPDDAKPDNLKSISRAEAIASLFALGEGLKAQLQPPAPAGAAGGKAGISQFAAKVLQKLRLDVPQFPWPEEGAQAAHSQGGGSSSSGGGGPGTGVQLSIKTDFDHVSLIVVLEGKSKFDLFESGKVPQLENVRKFVQDHLAAQGVTVEPEVKRVVDRPEDFRGGVEFGMMSTTADKATALRYSGAKHNRPVVLEVAAGRIDVGATLQFLSQYPGEKEYLMPPLTCLEVTGPIRVESLELEVEADKPAESLELQVKPKKLPKQDVLFVPVRANVNLKSMTIEEYKAQRKRTHLATFRLMIEELWYEMTDLIDSDADAVRSKLYNERQKDNAAKELVQTIILNCWKVLRLHESGEDEYNQELYYRQRVTEMLQVKTMALSKLKLWKENDRERIGRVKEMDLRDAHRRYIVHLQEELKAALTRAELEKAKDAKVAIDTSSLKQLTGSLRKLNRGQSLNMMLKGELRSAKAKKKVDGKQEGEKVQSVESIATEICKCKGLFEVAIDEKNDLNETRLMEAAAEGESAVNLRLLKHAGAHIDDGHKVPEVKFRHTDAAESDNDGALEGRNLNFKSAIMIAAENGHADTVRILHELGARVDDIWEGLSAVMLAAENGHKEAVKTLWQLNADIHAVASTGQAAGKSCLMLAAKNGHSETVRQLFDLRANLWSPGSKQSPFILAAENGHLDTLRTLIDLARQRQGQSYNGLNTIFHAAKQGERSLLGRILSAKFWERLWRPDDFDEHMQETLNVFRSRKKQTMRAVESLTYNLQKAQSLATELRGVDKQLNKGKDAAKKEAADRQKGPQALDSHDVSEDLITKFQSEELNKAIEELEEIPLLHTLYTMIKSSAHSDVSVSAATNGPPAATAAAAAREEATPEAPPEAAAAREEATPEKAELEFLHESAAYLALMSHFMLEFRGLSA